MSLFQCQHCGCCENTALSFQGCDGPLVRSFDWTEFVDDRKGKKLCSACAPATFRDGEPSGLGKWHDQFDRTYLPMGEFKTNQVGNLEHIKTGSEKFMDFAIDAPIEVTVTQEAWDSDMYENPKDKP